MCRKTPSALYRGAMMAVAEVFVADDTTPAHSDRELEAELNRSRESAVRLLEGFARKMGTARHSAGVKLHRTVEYVQTRSVGNMAAGLGGVARRRPLQAFAAAAVVSYLITRAVRAR